jgi:hypothetical protein
MLYIYIYPPTPADAGERAREEEEQLLQVTAPNNGGKNWKKARFL